MNGRRWHIDVTAVRGGAQDGLGLYDVVIDGDPHHMTADEFRELCEVGLALLDKDEAAA